MIQNLIMRSIINVYNHGNSQIQSDLPYSDLEKARWELMDRGYECLIVSEFKKLHFIVYGKSEKLTYQKLQDTPSNGAGKEHLFPKSLDKLFKA